MLHICVTVTNRYPYKYVEPKNEFRFGSHLSFGNALRVGSSIWEKVNGTWTESRRLESRKLDRACVGFGGAAAVAPADKKEEEIVYSSHHPAVAPQREYIHCSGCGSLYSSDALSNLRTGEYYCPTCIRAIGANWGCD